MNGDDVPTVEPSGREFYPAALRSRDWWVNWVLAVRYDEVEAGEPAEDAIPTKQPVAPYQQGDADPCRWHAGLDDEEHPATSYERVHKWDGKKVGLDVQAPERVLSDELGVGIIIPVGGDEEQPVTLLDWDDVRDPETGEVHPTCAWALEELDGYAEISQSGEGIHQFVFGEIPGGRRKYLRHLDGAPVVGDDPPMVEMYCSGRLTAMTGRHIDGSGEDVVDGQDVINELCYRLRNNSNNSTSTPSHPFGDDVDREADPVPSTDDVASVVESDMSFEGEHPDNWELNGAPVKYAAVLRGRDRKRESELPSVANWKLIRYAALLGHEAGFSENRVLRDLADHPAWPDESDKSRCKRHVRSAWRAAEAGRLSRPSVEKLKRCGLLPRDYVVLDELTADDELTPKEKWKAWAEARATGGLDAESKVPVQALRHVAEEQNLYDFTGLELDAGELPLAAHNRALTWVQYDWAESVGIDPDEERATARNHWSREGGPVYSWEDVRYVYKESAQDGRQAAEDLLRSKYEFMTVEGRDALMVYDPDTGHFTQSLAPVRGELHEELKSYWSTHELNEILQRLRQKPIVEPRDLNGRSEFDEPHICVENGVLNLFESELKDHSPEYRFVDRVPQTFDPDASTEPYEEFLNDVTAREADWKAMMEMAGHALVPDANERYKKFLILTGDSDNGKSVFFSRVKELLEGVDGEENNVMSVKLSKIASQRFSKKAVYGSMANVAGEIDGKKIRNTADLKDITGGDEQEIEPKGGESFSDTINSTLMFAANDPPIIGERDKSAIATRIVPVELPYQFVEDPDGPMQKQRRPERELEDELCTDEAMSGFLNLALDGIQRLEENHGDVSLPEPPMERLKKYEKAADPMKEFAAECLANEDGEYVAKADVTSIYKEFAADNDYETGSNIHSVLHGVLQGTKELNYTTSRPEPADYASTSLPLRPWSERKRVLDRVTLTEKGLEYAEMAGLLVDATEADGEDKDYIPLSELTETRKQFVTLEATAVTVRPGRGENGPEGNVVLDDGEEMAEVTFWESHPSEYGVEEGGEYRIEGLKLNYQGQQISLQSVDGVTEAVPLGEVPSDGPSPGGDGEQSSLSDADAAADGGETIPEDAEGAEANAKRIANYLAREGEAKSRASLAGHFNGKMDSDEFDAAMDKAVTKGLIVHAGADDYEANR